jgi:GTP cyclohydrolase IA
MGNKKELESIYFKGEGIIDEVDYTRIERFSKDRTEKLVKLYKSILELIEPDSKREGLKKTPLRVAKAIQFMTHGYNIDPKKMLESATFDEDYKQMVIVKDIEIYSMCEHHLVPFFGKAHIAYIPDKKITGLSKIARVVDVYARRLQVQERLTMQIRDCIQESLNPLGVAVVVEAQHLCMMMRGVQKQNSVTTTSAFTGIFLKETKTREEFIHLIGTRLH